MTYLPANAVIFLIILGAGFAIVAAYTVYKLYGRDRYDIDDAMQGPGPEQESYMRAVRLRNQRALLWEAGGGKGVGGGGGGGGGGGVRY